MTSLLLLLAAQFASIAALNVIQAPVGLLRGSNKSVDERGERGHFYYADDCEDCFYKGTGCGCQQAMEYFACVTKHCHSSNDTMFEDRCSRLSDQCSSEMDLQCKGPETACEGKQNQRPAGGIGLTLDLDGVGDDAFCGPHGKCIGKIHMKVKIHSAAIPPYNPLNAPAPNPVLGAPAPASSFSSSPFPAPAPAAAPAPSLTLECGLPKATDADIKDPSQWILCKTSVSGDRAGCDLPMFPTLQAAEGKKAYCLLTEAAEKDGTSKRLTEPAWFLVSNIHAKKPVEEESSGRRESMVCTLIWALAGLLTYAVKDL